MNCKKLSLDASGVAGGARIRALTDRASMMSRCLPPFLATQNSPTYSLVVSTGWNNPLAICFLKKTQSPPSVVFEDWVQSRVRHFHLTVVFQLHALLITLQVPSAHLRKHLEELRRTDTRSALKGTSVLLGPSSP